MSFIRCVWHSSISQRINEERAAAKEAAVVEDAEKAEEAVEEASEPAEA